MPRHAREKVGNSIYHICVRGNNKEAIFLDDEDRHAYLDRLCHFKERYKMHVYAYCLMTNHVHLLIYDNDEDISKFMQGLNLSYAIYFNARHGRIGHLFQQRFTSVLVKTDAQILRTSKYIHLNPVKAGMVKKVEEYGWSSYSAYLNNKNVLNIVDTQFLSEMISSNLEQGCRTYAQYVEDENQAENQDENDEIATTMDEKGEDSKRLTGIKRLSYEEVYAILCEKWKAKDKNILMQHFCRKEEVIYLLGIISRLSWAEIGRRLNIEESTIYRKIKGVSSCMIRSSSYCKRIDEIIFDI